MNIVALGEILWDLIDGNEHLGGAPFNFAVHASRLGHDVSFVSSVGRDARGDRAIQRAAELGLSSRHIHRRTAHKTGVVDVTVTADGQPSYTIRRPAAYDYPELSLDEMETLSAQNIDWVYFGTLQQMSPTARQLVQRVVEQNPGAGRFYDVNLRRDCYSQDLIEDLLQLATVVKLNDHEAFELAEMFGLPRDSLKEFCRAGKERYGWDAVCLTRGKDGCSLLVHDEYVERPAQTVTVVDTVGAGDAFSAAFLHGMNAHWEAARIADFANRVGALIAGRAGATPAWDISELS